MEFVYYKGMYLLIMTAGIKKDEDQGGCRCNERLEAKTEGSTCLTYIGLCGGLEHLKIESRLRGDSFSESCLLLIDKELNVELT